jgi:hypothetical protein
MQTLVAGVGSRESEVGSWESGVCNVLPSYAPLR